MKTLKQILGWTGLAVLLLLGGALSADGSGITGVPQYINARNITLTPPTGFVNGVDITLPASNPGYFLHGVSSSGVSLSLSCGTTCVLASSAGLGLTAATGNCVGLTSDVTGETLLPCSAASGAGNYIFTGKAAQTVKSGQFYGFELTNGTSTCVPVTNSPGFPTGWSAAHTATGECTITFPAVAQGDSMITVANGAGSGLCLVGAHSASSARIDCYTGGTTLTNVTFFVILQDWN